MTVPSRSISFEVKGHTQKITLPEPQSEDCGSVFLVGLPKAGSTLLNRVMTPLFEHVGLTPFSLHQTFRQMGLEPKFYPKDVSPLFADKGYAYIGFRGWNNRYPVPECASGRTVFLVRDPRDMIVSKYYSEAFSHRPPGTQVDDTLAKRFEERRRELQSQSVDEYVVSDAAAVLRSYRRTLEKLESIEYRTWRYEDVIFDKLRWVQDMLDYLQLEVPDGVVTRVVARNDIRPAAEVADQHVRKVTPGDHRTKLTHATINKLNEIFSDILDQYNYITD